MKVEAFYFSLVAFFFAVTASVYAWFSREPAGSAALIVSFLMSALISFFFWTQHHRRGPRPEDRRDGEIRERSGPLDFFSPHSVWPVVAAAGFAILALGVVFGLWLFIIGFGIVGYGVFGFVFQYARKPD
jgi:hypothetical protein